MNEMVERVARALIAVAEHGLDTDPDRVVDDAYQNPSHPAWQDYVEDARHAIAATREPTETMLLAGLEVESSIHGVPQCAGLIWRAMVDDALKD